jgi:hypothetical protein
MVGMNIVIMDGYGWMNMVGMVGIVSMVSMVGMVGMVGGYEIG